MLDSSNHDMTALLDSLVRGGAIPPFVYCYPTRSAYRELDSHWTLEQIWDEDFHNSLTRDVNIYIHVPFCRYKCGFCNLYTVTTTEQDLYDAYVDALCQELRRHQDIIRKRNVRTVYIGGGTPSLLSIGHFEKIFATLDEVCGNWRPGVEEVCIEATPDSIVSTPSTITRLMELGLTRVNMGVQSLEPAELREAGRLRAGAEVIHQATAIIKEHGLPNHSTDLIMGFAGQTDESWLRSVQALIALAPETISTYFLTVRPDAWFSKTGKYIYQRGPELYSRYATARNLILAAGYVQESNVRYKKMGLGGYRQKVLQFHGVPVLGIGAGARTYTNTVDYIFGGSSTPDPSQVWDYIREVQSGGAKIRCGFVFDDVERIRKRMALDLFDLDVSGLEQYQYSKHRSQFEPILNASIALGLARKVGETRYQLTSEGYMYRDIISWLMFSETVIERDREFYEELHQANRMAVEGIGTSVPVSGLRIGGTTAGRSA
jgi:oxygen-independent coproporphyrinogen III oxidase